MSNPFKIALMGAGSGVVFSMRLTADLCLSKGLYGSTISLMNKGCQTSEEAHQLLHDATENLDWRWPSMPP